MVIIIFRNSPISIVTNGFTISNMSLYDMEESFTIHLGSQMKSTHNIRIMSADTLNLLSLTLEENGYIICDMKIKLLIIIIIYFLFLEQLFIILKGYKQY
jgi:hypothetical protein